MKARPVLIGPGPNYIRFRHVIPLPLGPGVAAVIQLGLPCVIVVGRGIDRIGHQTAATARVAPAVLCVCGCVGAPDAARAATAFGCAGGAPVTRAVAAVRCAAATPATQATA